MTAHGRYLAGWCTAALFALALFPRPAAGITLTLRDVADPVPPGGILTYTLRVNNSEGGSGGGTVVCFNPPPQCVTFPASCSIGSPTCVGNSFTGYVCENAANEGGNCGIGDPPVPDLTLCVPRTTGTCDGGSNAGFPCSSGADCPGETFVCTHAFNEGEFCGVGNPPHADSSFCLANPTGVCSGGPNIGLPCTAPHNSITSECPADAGGEQTNAIVVTLPIPPETTFLDADEAGVSNGAVITWALSTLEPCGSAGLPQCPLLTARLIVDPLTPLGTRIENTATVTSPQGTAESGTPKTTVGTFRLQRFIIAKGKREGRDRFIYRVVLTLGPTAEIDPANETFRIQVETPSGQPLVDLELPAGKLLPFSRTGYKFVSREAGLARVVLRELADSHYRLNVNARLLSIPTPGQFGAIATMTLGDDVMSQTLSLVVRRAGRKFIGLKD